MPKQNNKPSRVFDARPDSMDFRDKMYEASLVEVPPRMDLESYTKFNIPILDQGQEGACTGFGLATVANYLLSKRTINPDSEKVSPRMYYEMAKRYDEWPGEDYNGSSARGAMKGWHKHGVCSEQHWPYEVSIPDRNLTAERIQNATSRPLGAYFRVNHKNLVSMHAAIAEVGILYATAIVHEGWQQIDSKGVIPLKAQTLGGHAFAIVGYDDRGFWVQNSWGSNWGKDGFALVTYNDWLLHSTDVWVARLGVPLTVQNQSASVNNTAFGEKPDTYNFQDLRPHIISIGNEGQLRTSGVYGTSAIDVEEILTKDFTTITKNWKKKRLMLYAHGGLTSEDLAIQRVADYRNALLAAEVYPLSFIWKSDYWTTLKNILSDALSRRRPEGFLDSTKDFMLDRLDDALEPIARNLTGKAQWDEMKENALMATTSSTGGARFALKLIAKLMEQDPKIEIHIVGHSAGSIFHAPLVQLLTAPKKKIKTGIMKGKTGLGQKIKTCTMWAPACTMDIFRAAYQPSIENKAIEQFSLFTLTDKAEQDDHLANIYHKSLLYMVSNAFEEKARIPIFRDGKALLGMEKFIEDKDNEDVKKLFKSRNNADWIRSPNTEPDGSASHSTSTSHGGFDDDKPTLIATLKRILGTRKKVNENFNFRPSQSSLKDKRGMLG
jgi:hypothetical protein